MLFSTDAGGVGLNLQRASNCCVNLELPWNPAVLEQRIGRIYRLGQTSPIDVYNLMSRDCIEERIAALVSSKKALFDGLFDGTSDEVKFNQSGSFMSTVARIIETPDAQADDDATAEDEQAVERELEQTLDTSDQLEPAVRAEGADRLEPAGAGASLVEVKPSAQPPHRRAPAAANVSSSHPVTPQRPGSAANVADLFSRLTIRTMHDGGVSIDAPPEAAADLAAVFEGLASILRSSSQDPLPGRDDERNPGRP